MELLETSKTEKIGKYYRKYLQAKCDCGNVFWVRADSSKKTKSCGCLQKNKVSEGNKRFLKHGFSKNNKIYYTWKNIKSRCSTKSNNKHYGGRGISVCDEWKNDFKSFYDWSFSNGYKEGLSIDRIDNDGNYEPSNCRWTTHEVQTRNIRKIRKNNTSGFKGAYAKKNKFQSMIGVNKKYIFIGLFNTPEEAGYAYDKYVIENNLEHTTNGLYKKEAV